MHHIYAKSFLSVSFLLFILQTSAQKSNKENAPYSRFGIGEMRNGANVFLRGMGTTSSSYASSYNVNTDNPASYASLLLTTYEAAAEGSGRTILVGTDKYKTGTATLSYMTVGVPIGKHAGMALGLKPVSRTYYLLNDTTMIDSFGKAVNSYEGDGSLSQGFIGFAGKYKGISLGFNFGYTFGTTESINSLEPLDQSNKVVSSRFYTKTRTGGIYWSLGAMYEHNLNKNLVLRGGGTLSLSQQLNAHRDQYWISYAYETDTAYKRENVSGKIVMPLKYSAGVQLLGYNKWSVALDFSSAVWSQYRSFGNTDSLASGTYRIAIGGDYTPDPTAVKNYLQKMTYRLGFYYGTDPVMLRATQLNYYAVTAGFTFPLKKNISRIHTSIEIGSRGTKANGLLRENFVRFGIGLSLNDKWFIKRKYD